MEVGFDREDDDAKAAVTTLLQWSPVTVAKMQSKIFAASFQDKQLIMFGYFFETVYRLCMKSQDNVSKSAGFESLIGFRS